ncbi:tripartite tricarboxylate transporter TctB family protein [Aliigemmobacter aestuarii]|uniref:Tripartite tricarboxylate transporter TctB family protein n=1 Tax=Aliigemmobacter aestuarii TaxID=1445661 RepID=A0A4V3V0V8_9RHOB|nr:tripartite tricarboxylate transporter TctB family protein [Gemmobacter aestuarii]THD85422.1 tripartite tricarboxylate transporter TctB family protein [Gemmobacter aestuarii]
MKSDRIFGLVVLIVALAFFVGATQVQTSFLSDPVGPRVFPMLIALAAGLCGLVLLMRPDAEPEWPSARSWGAMGIACAVLIGYAYALPPLGFLIPTAIAAGAISFLMSPRAVPAAITGAALSAGLFVAFKYGLGLGLFALPRGLMG